MMSPFKIASHRLLLATASFLLLLIATSACKFGHSSQDSRTVVNGPSSGGDYGAFANFSNNACSENIDCAPYHICDGGICTEGCRESSECASGEVCSIDGQCETEVPGLNTIGGLAPGTLKLSAQEFAIAPQQSQIVAISWNGTSGVSVAADPGIELTCNAGDEAESFCDFPANDSGTYSFQFIVTTPVANAAPTIRVSASGLDSQIAINVIEPEKDAVVDLAGAYQGSAILQNPLATANAFAVALQAQIWPAKDGKRTMTISDRTGVLFPEPVVMHLTEGPQPRLTIGDFIALKQKIRNINYQYAAKPFVTSLAVNNRANGQLQFALKIEYHLPGFAETIATVWSVNLTQMDQTPPTAMPPAFVARESIYKADSQLDFVSDIDRLIRTRPQAARTWSQSYLSPIHAPDDETAAGNIFMCATEKRPQDLGTEILQRYFSEAFAFSALQATATTDQNLGASENGTATRLTISGSGEQIFKDQDIIYCAGQVADSLAISAGTVTKENNACPDVAADSSSRLVRFDFCQEVQKKFGCTIEAIDRPGVEAEFSDITWTLQADNRECRYTASSYKNPLDFNRGCRLPPIAPACVDGIMCKTKAGSAENTPRLTLSKVGAFQDLVCDENNTNDQAGGFVAPIESKSELIQGISSIAEVVDSCFLEYARFYDGSTTVASNPDTLFSAERCLSPLRFIYAMEQTAKVIPQAPLVRQAGSPYHKAAVGTYGRLFQKLVDFQRFMTAMGQNNATLYTFVRPQNAADITGADSRIWTNTKAILDKTIENAANGWGYILSPGTLKQLAQLPADYLAPTGSDALLADYRRYWLEWQAPSTEAIADAKRSFSRDGSLIASVFALANQNSMAAKNLLDKVRFSGDLESNMVTTRGLMSRSFMGYILAQSLLKRYENHMKQTQPDFNSDAVPATKEIYALRSEYLDHLAEYATLVNTMYTNNNYLGFQSGEFPYYIGAETAEIQTVGARVAIISKSLLGNGSEQGLIRDELSRFKEAEEEVKDSLQSVTQYALDNTETAKSQKAETVDTLREYANTITELCGFSPSGTFSNDGADINIINSFLSDGFSPQSCFLDFDHLRNQGSCQVDFEAYQRSISADDINLRICYAQEITRLWPGAAAPIRELAAFRLPAGTPTTNCSEDLQVCSQFADGRVLSALPETFRVLTISEIPAHIRDQATKTCGALYSRGRQQLPNLTVKGSSLAQREDHTGNDTSISRYQDPSTILNANDGMQSCLKGSIGDTYYKLQTQISELESLMIRSREWVKNALIEHELCELEYEFEAGANGAVARRQRYIEQKKQIRNERLNLQGVKEGLEAVKECANAISSWESVGDNPLREKLKQYNIVGGCLASGSIAVLEQNINALNTKLENIEDDFEINEKSLEADFKYEKCVTEIKKTTDVGSQGYIAEFNTKLVEIKATMAEVNNMQRRAASAYASGRSHAARINADFAKVNYIRQFLNLDERIQKVIAAFPTKLEDTKRLVYLGAKAVKYELQVDTKRYEQAIYQASSYIELDAIATELSKIAASGTPPNANLTLGRHQVNISLRDVIIGNRVDSEALRVTMLRRALNERRNHIFKNNDPNGEFLGIRLPFELKYTDFRTLGGNAVNLADLCAEQVWNTAVFFEGEEGFAESDDAANQEYSVRIGKLMHGTYRNWCRAQTESVFQITTMRPSINYFLPGRALVAQDDPMSYWLVSDISSKIYSQDSYERIYMDDESPAYQAMPFYGEYFVEIPANALKGIHKQKGSYINQGGIDIDLLTDIKLIMTLHAFSRFK